MMGSCNGRAEIIDLDEAKKLALEASLKTVEVAKNQQEDLLKKFREVYDYFEPESYDSQDHWFLEIPEEVSELKTLIEYLKRYSVTMDQILSEEFSDDSYREAFVFAKYQVAQLIEYLQHLLILTYGDNAVLDDAYPSLPENLNTDSSQSARQTRDYLVIRDYGQLLDLIQRVLSDFQ